MKGIVFNLLEEVVVRQHGETTWDDLLDATGLQGPTPRWAIIRARKWKSWFLQVPSSWKITHRGLAVVRTRSNPPAREALSGVLHRAPYDAVVCLEREQHHPSRSAKLYAGGPLSFFRFEGRAMAPC